MIDVSGTLEKPLLTAPTLVTVARSKSQSSVTNGHRPDTSTSTVLLPVVLVSVVLVSVVLLPVVPVSVIPVPVILLPVVMLPVVFAPFGFRTVGRHGLGHGSVAGFRTAIAARRRLDRTTLATGAGVRRRRRRSVFFFVLDPPVLEPDFHLFLGQPQTVGDLDASEPGQVHVGRELAFQLKQLVTGERRPDPLRTSGVRVALAVAPERIRCTF